MNAFKKYKLILPAKEIPNNTIVTKATGTKPYRLQRELPIYSKYFEKTEIEVNFPSESVFLIGQGSIEIIVPDMPLSISFNYSSDLKEFVEDHLLEE
jgi:hypothetical protein